jgi:hypothetical protein
MTKENNLIDEVSKITNLSYEEVDNILFFYDLDFNEKIENVKIEILVEYVLNKMTKKD